MPWYWTDDIAKYMIENGQIAPEAVAALLATPAALRRDEGDLASAVRSLIEDDEIPLAA